MPGKVGQDGGEVPTPLQHGAGRTDQVDAEFGGHDLRQRRLAEARVAVKKDVIHRLSALAGGIEEHPEIRPQFLLPDEILQP